MTEELERNDQGEVIITTVLTNNRREIIKGIDQLDKKIIKLARYTELNRRVNKLDRVIEHYYPNKYPLKTYSFYGNLAGSIFRLFLVTYNLSEIEYNSRSQLGRAVKLVDLCRSQAQKDIQCLHGLSNKGSNKITTSKDYSEAFDEYYSEYKRLKANAERGSHAGHNQVGITIGISFLVAFVPSLIKQLKYIVSNPYQ